ncbi:unnamed protein product [Rhizophagus irregularis]|uniref:Uncharacterized protein n=1 Tax=Rhizophagus irregularis TaxID=588596 RepID=A0A915YN19_9GLOM|nr:unnamed protein product [Rhizophagus irregularis]
MASSGQEVAKQSGQNSHKKKGTEKIVQVITDGMMAEPSIQDNIKHQESNSSNSKALHMTEISATARRPKCSSSLLDLAKLFDKASDAEYRTKKANEEEILCWVNFGKEFMVHFSELVENSNGKIGEKKAKERVPKGPRDNSAEQDDFPTPEISAGNLETSEKILPEENSSLSADLEDYVKTLTGDFDDETAYWGTPYENEARVEKEEPVDPASIGWKCEESSRLSYDTACIGKL